MLIRSATPLERTHLLGVAVRTGLFSQAEAESVLGAVLNDLANSGLPPAHQVLSCHKSQDGPAVGWCYFAPDVYAAGVWNLWWIGVDPREHGCGAAQAMLARVEEAVMAANGRLLIVETSAAEHLARARRFYAKSGYLECGRIPHFYAENETKVIFARSLGGAA